MLRTERTFCIMKNRYAFLGVGNMASAIIRGISADGVSPSDSILYDINSEKCEAFAKEGFAVAKSAAEAVRFADFIVLAVQPQAFPSLIGELRESGVCTDGKCFVSIAAGVSIGKICELFGKEVAIIRTMPNAPLMIGKGVTALTRNTLVNDKSFGTVCRMFSRVGEILTLPEDKMNEVISVTSSAPAYVYLFIKSITDAAIAQGISDDEKFMKDIICRMVIGAAELMLGSNESPDALIRRVCTPGGTTEPAVQTLIDRGMPQIIADAMDACVKRAGELGK